VKRIDIYYGGRHYSVGGRALADLRAEIDQILSRGSGWIEVNYGEGSMAPAQLLIAPGVGIALLPVAGDESDGEA
jgi:hypothetical protein